MGGFGILRGIGEAGAGVVRGVQEAEERRRRHLLEDIQRRMMTVRQPFGQPVRGADGRMYQVYLDPLTGRLNYEPLPVGMAGAAAQQAGLHTDTQGNLYGVMWEPTTGTYKTSLLVRAGSPEDFQKATSDVLAGVPEDQREDISRNVQAIQRTEGPRAALDYAVKQSDQIRLWRIKQEPKPINAWERDPGSTTGYVLLTYDAEGGVARRIPNVLPPPGYLPRRGVRILQVLNANGTVSFIEQPIVTGPILPGAPKKPAPPAGAAPAGGRAPAPRRGRELFRGVGGRAQAEARDLDQQIAKLKNSLVDPRLTPILDDKAKAAINQRVAELQGRRDALQRRLEAATAGPVSLFGGQQRTLSQVLAEAPPEQRKRVRELPVGAVVIMPDGTHLKRVGADAFEVVQSGR